MKILELWEEYHDEHTIDLACMGELRGGPFAVWINVPRAAIGSGNSDDIKGELMSRWYEQAEYLDDTLLSKLCSA